MKAKPKPSPLPEKISGRNSVPARPRQTQDQRWQRTVRFNWDKGGSKGGRK